MIDWLRYYHSTPFDPKWRFAARLARCRAGDVLAVFDTMLVAASTHEKRGSLASWRADVTAIGLEFDEDLVARIFEALRGLVHDGERLTGWDRLQKDKEDPTAAERQRRKRQRERDGVTSRQSRLEETREDSTHTKTGANIGAPTYEDVAALTDLLFAAAGSAMADPAKFPKLYDVGDILALTGPADGLPCDLHRHVLPAIQIRARRLDDGTIRSWRYVRDFILEFRDACLAGAPLPQPRKEGAHGSSEHRRSRLESNLNGALAAAERVVARSDRLAG
jgi:hypothetical protein